MRSLKKVVTIALMEWKKWLRNPRIMTAFMLAIVAQSLVITPLADRAERTGMPSTVFEPFIAMGNSTILVLLLPTVFLILISDFPVLEPNSLLYLSRCGKRCWFWGQILFAVMSVVTYLGGMFVLLTLFALGDTEFSFSWSEATRTLLSHFDDFQDSYVSALLPSNLYNQLSLPMALFYTFTLLALYLLLLMLIIMFFAMLRKRGIGIMTAFLTLLLGLAVSLFHFRKAMWVLPMAHAITTLHFHEIFREQYFPIGGSFVYFAVLIALLIVGCRLLLRHMEFDSNQ